MNVTLAPTTTVLADEVSVIVLAVVPVELPGACQKSPHPASNSAAAPDNRIKTLPSPTAILFTPRTLIL